MLLNYFKIGDHKIESSHRTTVHLYLSHHTYIGTTAPNSDSEYKPSTIWTSTIYDCAIPFSMLYLSLNLPFLLDKIINLANRASKVPSAKSNHTWIALLTVFWLCLIWLLETWVCTIKEREKHRTVDLLYIHNNYKLIIIKKHIHTSVSW